MLYHKAFNTQAKSVNPIYIRYNIIATSVVFVVTAAVTTAVIDQ
jgi:hypothetical protein